MDVSQSLYSLLLLPHGTVCQCLRRNGPRCQYAVFHLQRWPRGWHPDWPTGFYPALWPWERHNTENNTTSVVCRVGLQSADICLQMCHLWLKCTHFFIFVPSDGQIEAVFAATVSQSNPSALQQGTQVRMTLTHLRCRGWAKPRWQLRWGVCFSAEGWADRRWEVFGTLTPPLGS